MSKKKTSQKSAEESLERYIKAIEKEQKAQIIDIDSHEDKKQLEKYFKYLSDFEISNVQEECGAPILLICDAGKPFVKKRFNTILKTLPKAVAQFSDRYPNLCIANEFVAANATYNALTYDVLDAVENITLAAAIWILDELEQRGDLDEVLPLLPDEDEISGIRLPELFEDACFDNSLIAGMMYIIHNRNDDSELYKQGSGKPYINEMSLKRSEQTHEYPAVDDPLVNCETNRQKFDFIMSLINPVVIERIIKRFEDKEWEVFDRYLQCVNKYREEELQLNKKILDALQKQKRLFPIITKTREERERLAQDFLRGGNRNVLLTKQPSIDELLDLHSSVPVANDRKIIERSAEEREFDKLIDTITASEERKDKLRALHEATAYFVGSTKLDGTLRPDDIPEESMPDVELLYQLDVSNPFETCFALLYLLDSGSPLPWLAPLGVMVIQAASQLLPWHKYPAYEEDDDEYDDYDDYDDMDEDEEDNEVDEIDDDPDRIDADDESQEFESANDTIVPIDWIEEEAKFYKQKYKYPRYNYETNDYYPDESTILNFSQFIYSQTNLVVPRNVFTNLDMADIYMLAGFDESESKLLEKFITLADFEFTKSVARRKKQSGNYAENEEAEIKVEEDASEQVDIKSLKQEIRRLKEEINRSHDEKRGLLRESEALKAENETLTKEISELRTMIRSSKPADSAKQIENVPEIAFPYTAKGRYVVFGGHDSWARAIKPLLENVRFIDAGAHPNVGLILHADTVWVQSNAIGHSDYYKILDVVRTHGIKLEYFSYASAEKCAEQLALYDLTKKTESRSYEHGEKQEQNIERN